MFTEEIYSLIFANDECWFVYDGWYRPSALQIYDCQLMDA